jgi:hypothetical protein
LIKKDDFLKIKGEMNFKLEDVNFKIQEIPWHKKIHYLEELYFFNFCDIGIKDLKYLKKLIVYIYI